MSHQSPGVGISPSRIRGLLLGVGASLVLGLAIGAPADATAASRAKYYFQLHEVQSRVAINGDLRQFAGEALKAELASRPEWESDLGGATREEEVASELKKRRLSGFDLIVKITELKKDVKETVPGSPLKKLSVSVKLAVLGTTMPGNKMAFGGDGEASAEADVSERRIDQESQSMFKDAITESLKQAVDQVVLKLGTPKSTPMNESKRKRAAPPKTKPKSAD